jgi:hypothetical protein
VQHLRKKSSALFSLAPTAKATSLSFSSNLEGNLPHRKEETEISFATLGEMASRKDPYMQTSTPLGAPPEYQLDREDTLNPSPWDVRHWGWKKWAALGAGAVIVIIIVVVVAVVVTKKNQYPDYSQLTYTLADTCKYPPLFILPCWSFLQPRTLY